ncbi:TonB-dependent receptor [Emcibacter sp. SYSU 3D8]|uniref:TonB-dependent receptor n=1 Tax=Emcibacter sp. SYSU 3D8 TaxID=3133969 RepID=UPI0031FF0CBE
MNAVGSKTAKSTSRRLPAKSLRNTSITASALSLSAAMLIPQQALAQDAPVKMLAPVKIEDTAIDPNPNAEVGVPYKARTSGDERHTRPLAETPQTISVLTKSQIDDSGYTDLVRILDAQPGITIGTGENGNAFGDRYIIRGQEARSDVFVDGLRDPGMTIRESFAIEQIEISKGPNSSFAGRGTSGGAINAITKQATNAFDFGKIGVGLGTDQHVRATVDVNHSFGEKFAVRANALYAYEEIPDRGPADRERKGLAVSGVFTPNDNLTLTLDYYGLRADDNPDLGSYLTDMLPTKGVPVYAQKQDFQSSDVDTFTARLAYSFSPDLRVMNLMRYGRSDNGYVVTGARGTTALDPDGDYASATLSTHQGWQDVEYFANQTNLFWDADLFGRKHDFIAGVEYTNHKVLNGVYNVNNTGSPNCMTGNATAPNSFCAIGPDGGAVNGLNTLLGREITRGNWDSDWGVETIAVYLLDTFDLTDRLSLFTGVRFDAYNFDLATQNSRTMALDRYKNSDSLWNGHVGVTYKVGGGGMFYASFASAADINGGESDVGTNSGYGGTVIYNGSIAGAAPERSINLEVGTKWNILDERLLLTAALFQSTKSDVMEGADYDSVGTFNTGKNRVRGVEFGVTGNVTDALTVQGGLTLMDSKVLKSATPDNVGKVLSNFAKYSAVLQAKYQLTEKFSFGGAVKYESKRFGGQPDTAASYAADGSYRVPVPGYAVFDLFATYQITDDLELRLNINNVGNKDYYLAVYRSGSFLYKGDGRTGRLTLTYDF